VGYDKFNCQGSFGSHLFLDIVVFPSWDSVHDYLRSGGDEQYNSNENDSKNSDGVDIGEGQEHSYSQNPVPIIGVLGAYGGGEEIFSPDAMPVYTDVDSYATLVPPVESADPNNLSASRLTQRSHPIHTRPFSTNVCFLLSKEKHGLPLAHARLCSSFVHVPHLTFDTDAPSALQPSQMSTSDTESIPPQAPLKTSTLKEPPPEPTIISQSTLLDTATTLSTVLHHFTAWAGYTERTFSENQKFEKDIKPNNRRRLCRVVGQNHKKDRDQNERNGAPDSNQGEEAIDAMMFWKESVDASQSGDY